MEHTQTKVVHSVLCKHISWHPLCQVLSGPISYSNLSPPISYSNLSPPISYSNLSPLISYSNPSHLIHFINSNADTCTVFRSTFAKRACVDFQNHFSEIFCLDGILDICRCIEYLEMTLKNMLGIIYLDRIPDICSLRRHDHQLRDYPK